MIALGTPETLHFGAVTVFDGEAWLAQQDVIVRDGKIEAIGPSPLPPPVGARWVSGAGRTLLPGLIDSHTHYQSPVVAPDGELWLPRPERNLEAWLAAGVTTVYDLGGRPKAHKGPRARGEAGLGPRIFGTAGTITAPGGHPVVVLEAVLPGWIARAAAREVPQFGEDDDPAELIAEIAAGGVDYVKIIADPLVPGTPVLSPGQVASLIEAVHAAGLPAVVHVGDAERALAAAEAGADLLAHGLYRGELSDAQIDRFAALGVPIVATLSGFEATVAMARGEWEPSDMDTALHPAEQLDATRGAAGLAFARDPVLGGFALTISPEMAAGVGRLSAAGVPILVGSDAPLPAVFPGSGYHRELAALHQHADIPLTTVLQGATSVAARQWSRDPGFGRLAPGQAADLVLVEGDPRADIAALSQIVGVWRLGRPVSRALE